MKINIKITNDTTTKNIDCKKLADLFKSNIILLYMPLIIGLNLENSTLELDYLTEMTNKELLSAQ